VNKIKNCPQEHDGTLGYEVRRVKTSG